MSNTMLTLSPEPSARWVEALEPLVLRSSLRGQRISASVTYWLDFSTLDFDKAVLMLDRIVVANDSAPIVCLVSVPNDEEAFAFLGRGARGLLPCCSCDDAAQTCRNYCKEWRFLAPQRL